MEHRGTPLPSWEISFHFSEKRFKAVKFHEATRSAKISVLSSWDYPRTAGEISVLGDQRSNEDYSTRNPQYPVGAAELCTMRSHEEGKLNAA